MCDTTPVLPGCLVNILPVPGVIREIRDWLLSSCLTAVSEQDRAEAAGSSSAASSSSAGALSSQANSSCSQAVPINVEAWREFEDHAHQTNDIFLVVAQAIASTLLRARAHLATGKPI